MTSETPAERQRRIVAGCRAAMPSLLENLWDTMTHAPDVVFPDLVLELQAGLPDPTQRMAALLVWLAHDTGECPVCHMLVARLPFTIPDPITVVGLALSAAPEADASHPLLDGACRFLREGLQARHALPAGVSRERLAELRLQRAELDAGVLERLEVRWRARGGEGDFLR